VESDGAAPKTCQYCGAPATVYYTEIQTLHTSEKPKVVLSRREVRACGKCAKEHGIAPPSDLRAPDEGKRL
jgi:hypothetical protein